MSGIVKGVSKGVGSAFKGIKKGLSKAFFEAPSDMLSKALKPSKWMKDNIPPGPKNPLMPDLESIEKSRRRRRNQKMGRTETIMTDTLG